MLQLKIQTEKECGVQRTHLETTDRVYGGSNNVFKLNNKAMKAYLEKARIHSTKIHRDYIYFLVMALNFITDKYGWKDKYGLSLGLDSDIINESMCDYQSVSASV